MDTLTLATAFKMVVSLGVVLMTFGAAVWIAKKFSVRGGIFAKKIVKNTTKPLEVLSFQSLGPGRNIYLVRCLDKKVLVGATNTQITHLANIDEDESEVMFAQTLQEKSPTHTEKRLKEHFDTSLKDMSRI